jgi:hypothetical protein
VVHANTQVTTFTDCVNCLIAFTNNPHSLDVSLNAIAFLRFCAMKLAEGAIGMPLYQTSHIAYCLTGLDLQPSGRLQVQSAALGKEVLNGMGSCASGDVEVLPEGSHSLLPDLNQHRIRPSKNEPDAYSTPSTSRRVTFEGLQAPAADEEVAARGNRRPSSVAHICLRTMHAIASTRPWLMKSDFCYFRQPHSTGEVVQAIPFPICLWVDPRRASHWAV